MSRIQPSPIFVARERELEELERLLETARAGQGMVSFVRGEAGTGKTALMSRFAERALQQDPELVTSGGRCNAITSIGDPYLPFCEVLGQLTGDMEAQAIAGTLTRPQGGGLAALLPQSLAAVMADGRGLIDTFVSGAALVARAKARREVGTEALEQLAGLSLMLFSMPGRTSWAPSFARPSVNRPEATPSTPSSWSARWCSREPWFATPRAA